MKLLSIVLCTLFVGLNAEDKKDYTVCYTCLGRDMDNCEVGETHCKEECMKLVDTTHNLIAKGCRDDRQYKKGNGGKVEDKDDDIEMPSVTLPFEKGAPPIKGTVYFCKGDKCNSASNVIISFGVMCSCILLLLKHYIV